MQKLLAALAILGLLAVAVPAHATTNERNLDFLLGMAGMEEAPEGFATLDHNGVVTQVTIDEAFRLAAARARGVDLASIINPAAPGDRKGAGDVWLIEFGTGACPTATTRDTSVPYQEVQPQLWTYAGKAGVMRSDSSTSGAILDWTTKLATGGGFRSGGTTIVGQGDFFCFTFIGYYFSFPYVDGVVVTN